MRVPMEWLADYVDLEIGADELANRLTMSGLKVEGVEQIGAEWRDVVIGQIVELEPHPRSTKPLHVARVDVGGGRTIRVVTGAQNVRRGDKIPVVLVGGLLPHGPDGAPMVIEPRPMAGITSEGMLASARELGISEEHSGIYVLPADALLGEPLRKLMGDDVLDIETNPNRPDTLSLIGVGREAAAVTEQQLTLPNLEAITGPITWLEEESVPVEIESFALCPRYSALRIEGVSVPAAPAWMQTRLQAAGMRPINLLVDITNYVMLEYGQPMHAFDASRLAGGRIVVRPARPGERLRTLDGVVRTLMPEDLVIADGERAAALAGVMGGEESEITPETTSIILESATFNPVSVRRTAQRQGLRSEASTRFEKGLPPEQTVPALYRYLQLLTQILPEPLRVARVSDVWVGAPPPRVVTMPMRELHRLLGVPIPQEQAAEALSLLGFEITEEAGAIRAVVPFWRRADIELPADLVEEVARLVGFDTIPSMLPRHTMPPSAPPPDLYWEGVVRDRLLGAGASEIVTGTLTAPAIMDKLFLPGSNGHDATSGEHWAPLVANPAGVYHHEALTLPLHLLNPPSKERTTLRLTLLPSMLAVVNRNLKHTDQRVAFFELARTYFARPEDLPYERRTLGLALSGQRRPRTWQEPSPGHYTFYDLKGMVAAVLEAMQITGWTVELRPHPALHPGRAAVIRLQGQDVGYLGELHPEVAQGFDIESWPVQVAEVDLDSLLPLASTTHLFHPLPRYPAALRDIAVLVGRDVPAGDILRVVQAAGGELLQSAEIFDLYAGASLPENSKSVAISMAFQAPGATLTQDEVVEIMDRITAALRQQLGATPRD